MKSVDQALFRSLRRQARKSAHSSPSLWKEYKRRRRARPGFEVIVIPHSVGALDFLQIRHASGNGLIYVLLLHRLNREGQQSQRAHGKSEGAMKLRHGENLARRASREIHPSIP